jgi:hypothetical protein
MSCGETRTPRELLCSTGTDVLFLTTVQNMSILTMELLIIPVVSSAKLIVDRQN